MGLQSAWRQLEEANRKPCSRGGAQEVHLRLKGVGQICFLRTRVQFYARIGPTVQETSRVSRRAIRILRYDSRGKVPYDVAKN